MATSSTQTKTTIYDQEYFSGSQVNIYIGDVLIDEITSMSFQVTENKRVWYGYGSQIFDAVSKGTILVEGQFSINYKEAGYLHLVLQRYQKLINQHKVNLITDGGHLKRNNIETQAFVDAIVNRTGLNPLTKEQEQEALQHLSGFNNPDNSVPGATGALGVAEKMFERFEDMIWSNSIDNKEERMITHQTLQDFSVTITYGDYNASDRVNHTVQEIEGIHLTSHGQMIKVDGDNIQEYYSFIGRNLL